MVTKIWEMGVPGPRLWRRIHQFWQPASTLGRNLVFLFFNAPKCKLAELVAERIFGSNAHENCFRSEAQNLDVAN